MTAAGQGLEPQYTGPKPVVLPLDEPAKMTATGRLPTSHRQLKRLHADTLSFPAQHDEDSNST